MAQLKTQSVKMPDGKVREIKVKSIAAEVLDQAAKRKAARRAKRSVKPESPTQS